MFPRKYLKPLLPLCSLPTDINKKEGNSEGSWLQTKDQQCFILYSKALYVVQAYLSSFKILNPYMKWPYRNDLNFVSLLSWIPFSKTNFLIKFTAFPFQSPVNFHPKLYHTLCGFPTVEDILWKNLFKKKRKLWCAHSKLKVWNISLNINHEIQLVHTEIQKKRK